MPPDFFQSILSSTWSIFLVILFFGGSIFVHELGHFLAARRRGVHVERFSIGFGPAIWSRRGKDGVEYRLSWIPLGGYVLLPQLADLGPVEGESKADLSKLPPVNYATKMIVFAAGAAFNVIFAFLLACVLWIAGNTVAEEEQTTRIGIARPTIEITPGTTRPGPAHVAGLRSQDVITAVDGVAVNSFNEINQLIALGAGRGQVNQPRVLIAYERDGIPMAPAIVHPELVGPDEIRDIGIEPATKVTVASVSPDSAAAEAGIKTEDILLKIDGRDVHYSSFVADYLRETGGRPVLASLLRQGQEIEVRVQPRKQIDAETKAEVYRLGLVLRGSYTIKTVHVQPWQQISQNVVLTWRNLKSLLHPKTDVDLSKMSSAVGIVRIFYSAAENGWRAVLWFTILININLAIFNLLPIPVLDGGQMLFATIARIRRRALPVNFVMATQSVFMVLLLTMILYVSVFDVRRWRRDAIAEREAAARSVPAPADSKK